MKWLEGWFGTASGVIGALIVAIVTTLVPTYSELSGSQTCSSYDGGPTTCSTTASQTVAGPQAALLVPIVIAFLLFILVVVGTWLDLRGARTAGRLILLISVSLLLAALLIILPAAAGGSGAAFAFIYPFALLAFVAGILACVRRDEPRSVALPTPRPPATTQE